MKDDTPLGAIRPPGTTKPLTGDARIQVTRDLARAVRHALTGYAEQGNPYLMVAHWPRGEPVPGHTHAKFLPADQHPTLRQQIRNLIDAYASAVGETHDFDLFMDPTHTTE